MPSPGSISTFVTNENLSGYSKHIFTAGMVHFALAGVLNIVLGVSLLYLSRSNRLLEILLSNAIQYMSSPQYLNSIDLFIFLASDVAILLGIVICLVGTLQLVATTRISRRGLHRLDLYLGSLGVMTIIALPWTVIGAACLIFSHSQRE